MNNRIYNAITLPYIAILANCYPSAIVSKAPPQLQLLPQGASERTGLHREVEAEVAVEVEGDPQTVLLTDPRRHLHQLWVPVNSFLRLQEMPCVCVLHRGNIFSEIEYEYGNNDESAME